MRRGETAGLVTGKAAAALGGAAALGLGLTGLAGLGVAGAAMAAPAGAPAGETTPAGASEADAGYGMDLAEQRQAQVVGTFSFTQDEVTPTERIARVMGAAGVYLCGNQPAPGQAGETGDWRISVEGDVAHPLVLDTADLRAERGETIVMGCSCTGNPVDGLASVNAEVTGVAVAALLRKAAPLAGANTVVFTSADGYEAALPLRWLDQHYCPLVFEVNGEAIANSMGGSNQLWLSSTPASYYVRDVVSVRVETRDEAPADPCTATRDASAVPAVAIVAG